METVKVQWQALSGEWLISAADGSAVSTLTEWASQLPDLTPVRLILAAQNYASHWLSLPGVSNRHLPRALPFALEESLIGDVADFSIVPAGSVHKKTRAYVITSELIERLLEACEVHHVQVRELIPETALLGSEAQIRRAQSGWLFSLPALFEGYVSDHALTPVLEGIFADGVQIEALTLKASSMDQLQLLQTMIETSFPDQVLGFRTDLIAPHEALAIPARPINFLTGRFQARVIEEKKPAAWWRVLAVAASVWLALWTLELALDVRTLKNQGTEVQQASIALYQSLFPNERIRSLERQFREKLSGGGNDNSAGFVSMTNALARAYQKSALQQSIKMDSLRFNDRLHELTVELRAASLTDLQSLRQAIEETGLSAEIASATNDKDGVKGRLRIGGQA